MAEGLGMPEGFWGVESLDLIELRLKSSLETWDWESFASELDALFCIVYDYSG